MIPFTRSPPKATKIPAHQMATTAMSDNMTIGLEQVFVSLTLMIISFYLLSRQQKTRFSIRRWVQKLVISPSAIICSKLAESVSVWVRRKCQGNRNRKDKHQNQTEDDRESTELKRLDSAEATRSKVARNQPLSKTLKPSRFITGTVNNPIYHSRYADSSVPKSPLRKCQSSPMIPSSIFTSSESQVQAQNFSTNNQISNSSNHTTEESTQHQQQQQQQQQQISSSITELDNWYEDTTTFTEHEKFAKTYDAHLRHDIHRILILPPACRLIDSASKRKQRDEKQQQERLLLSPSYKNKITQVASYMFEVIHKIVSFDYIEFTIIINVRIMKAFIFRYKRILVAWGFMKEVVEEEEDEEDDLTVGSYGSRRSLLSKESSHALGTSFSSVTGDVNPVGISGRGSPMTPNKNLSSTTYMSVLSSSQHHFAGGTGTTQHDSSEVGTTTTATATTSTQSPSLASCTNLIAPANSDGGDGNIRERFDTADSLSIPTLRKDDYLNSFFKTDDGKLSGIPRVDSNSSLSIFGESWEDGGSQKGELRSAQERNSFIFEEGEEKKNGSVGHNLNDLHPTKASLHTSSSNDAALMDSEMTISSSSSMDYPVGLENVVVKKAKKKAPPTSAHTGNNIQSGSPARYTILPRMPNKRKDALERHRKPALSQNSGFVLPPISSVPNSFHNSGSSSHNSARESSMAYFDTASNKAAIQKLEKDASLPDREGYILGDQYLEDPRDTPLLVFVNTRSGSQQGPMLKVQLRSLLNPIQVWDLADGGPEKILTSFKVFTRLRILVCGGDGTVSWIISALNNMKIERWPPIAILPLGTGNDLARIHGWGGGYANESLLLILKQVQEAYISLLDRWTMTIERKKRKKGGKKQSNECKPFTNYMSIGMDALSALQVHTLRENSPDMFFSRAINKLWYGLYGAEDAIKASCSDLPKQVVLEADGVEIPIPEDSQGLIFLNIDSYLGGVPLWNRGVPIYNKSSQKRPGRRYSDGDSIFKNMGNENGLKRTGSFDSKVGDDGDNGDNDDLKLESLLACNSPSSCQDGRLDVISIRGNFHLGQIRVGLANAQRLCQCSEVKITLKKSAAVQIDGEPWKQDKCVLKIKREKESAFMLHRAAEGGGGIESEVADLLEWAEEKTIINRDVHTTLMKEFSRRIESKTRARRDRNELTVFSAMTRGMKK